MSRGHIGSNVLQHTGHTGVFGSRSSLIVLSALITREHWLHLYLSAIPITCFSLMQKSEGKILFYDGKYFTEAPIYRELYQPIHDPDLSVLTSSWNTESTSFSIVLTDPLKVVRSSKSISTRQSIVRVRVQRVFPEVRIISHEVFSPF